MNTHMKTAALLTAALLATATLATTSANAAIIAGDVILIDFGKPGDDTWTGNGGPGAQTDGNWNNYTRTTDSGGTSGTLVGALVRFSDNSDTGVSLGASGNVGIGGANVTPVSPQLSFSSSGLIPSTAEQDLLFASVTSVLTFSGLDTGLTYNLEVLSHIDAARNAKNWTVQSGVVGVEQTISVDPEVAPFVVAFNGVTTVDGNLTLTLSGAGGGADLIHINAIELTAVPEPGSLALLGLGGLLIARRRRG